MILNLKSASGIRLAVLQPRKLSVFTVNTWGEGKDNGCQKPIKVLFEHNLSTHALALTIGPFGGLINEDHLCVQSLCGRLSFFEHERVGICCQLPHFLLPSAISYSPASDSFIVCDAAWNLQSYK